MISWFGESSSERAGFCYTLVLLTAHWQTRLDLAFLRFSEPVEFPLGSRVSRQARPPRAGAKTRVGDNAVIEAAESGEIGAAC